MRAFVAVPMPATIQDALGEVLNGLPGGRVVPTENLHLTLAFLDNVDLAALEELDDRLSALRAAAFALRIDGIGSFGRSAPRAVWARVASDPALAELHRRVLGAARGAGLKVPHRRFVPHVTLARFPDGHTETPGFRRWAAAWAGLSVPGVQVRSFALMSSILRPGGAAYHVLAEYTLWDRGPP